MINKFISVLTLSVLFACGASAGPLASHAGIGPHGEGRGAEARVDHMAENIKTELKLNSVQIERLEELKTAVKVQMAKRKAETEKERSDLNKGLQELVLSPKLDKGAVEKIVGKRGDLKEDAMEDVLDKVYPQLAAFHESLTQDQRQSASIKLGDVRGSWNKGKK